MGRDEEQALSVKYDGTQTGYDSPSLGRLGRNAGSKQREAPAPWLRRQRYQPPRPDPARPARRYDEASSIWRASRLAADAGNSPRRRSACRGGDDRTLKDARSRQCWRGPRCYARVEHRRHSQHIRSVQVAAARTEKSDIPIQALV